MVTHGNRPTAGSSCVRLMAAALLLSLASAQGGVAGFNKVIALELPLLNTELQKAIPASYGNCQASTASGPAPNICQDTGDNLYSVHKPWVYKAEARWITGLNTASFSSIVLTNSSGTFDGVQGAGMFQDLPASIHIEQCATFDRCTKLWDNTHACCGQDKHFSFGVKLSCDPSTHQLVDMGLSTVTIDDFKIQENVINSLIILTI
eukprot:TRINITY_DN618_c0_g2_i4.p2 TRINITY_DN618_c0_g2~~TRINITY_DN618_c0_g2_i4.p2  ORF type:complete len:206 (+),score=45.05 TRINITY_DN618_c0_g2_i4:123-740(+)